jgi:hypothetical protein
LPRIESSVTALLGQGSLRDADAQVRLAALLALAELPSQPASGEALVGALQDPRTLNDRWLTDAATSAAAQNAEHYLVALGQVRQPAGRLGDVTHIVAEHYARSRPGAAVQSLVRSLPGVEPVLAEAVLRGSAGAVDGRSTRIAAYAPAGGKPRPADPAGGRLGQ